MIMVGLDGFTCRLDRFRDFCQTQPRFYFIIHARFTDSRPLPFLPLIVDPNHSVGVFDSFDFRGLVVPGPTIRSLIQVWVDLQRGKNASRKTHWRNRHVVV